MTDVWRSLAAWMGFQVVWVTSALGAASGSAAPGIISALIFVLAMRCMKSLSGNAPVTLLVSGVFGFIAETALLWLDIVRFSAAWPSPHFAPAWIVALWVAFGATIGAFARLFGDHALIKSSIAGLVAGPLAYWAGARLSALDIVGSDIDACLAIGVVWAVAMPVLLMIETRPLQTGTSA